MRNILFLISFIWLPFLVSASEGFTGLWQSINEETGLRTSVTAIYEYDGQLYGRSILIYDKETGELSDTVFNPRFKAENIKGNPYYAGLDFIWELEKDGKKYKDGYIMDPQPAKTYSCEMWLENGNLHIKGKVMFFSKTQVWKPFSENEYPKGFEIPDLSSFIPEKPIPSDS